MLKEDKEFTDEELVRMVKRLKHLRKEINEIHNECYNESFNLSSFQLESDIIVELGKRRIDETL